MAFEDPDEMCAHELSDSNYLCTLEVYFQLFCFVKWMPSHIRFRHRYSCIKLTENAEERKRTCEWTHFMSEVDGSLDGAPTFYEALLAMQFSSPKHWHLYVAQ